MVPLFDNPFSPTTWFGYLNDAMKAMAGSVNEMIGNLLVMKLDLTNTSFAGFLYGNAIGVAPLLSYITCVTLAFLSLFMQKKIKSLGQALVMAVIVGGFAAGIMRGLTWLYETGTTLAEFAHFYKPDGTNAQGLPDITVVLQSIVSLGGLMMVGIPLTFLALAYAIVNVTMNAWLLPALTMYNLGGGFKKFVRMIISLILVTALLGRAVIALVIDVARAIAGSIPIIVASPATVLAMQTVGFLIAIASQGILIWLTYKSVPVIEGRLLDAIKANVTGDVKTYSQDRRDAALSQAVPLHTASAVPPAVRIHQQRLTVGQTAALEAKQRAIKGAVNVAVAAGSALGIPTPVLASAGKVAQARLLDNTRRRAYGQSLNRQFPTPKK